MNSNRSQSFFNVGIYGSPPLLSNLFNQWFNFISHSHTPKNSIPFIIQELSGFVPKNDVKLIPKDPMSTMSGLFKIENQLKDIALFSNPSWNKETVKQTIGDYLTMLGLEKTVMSLYPHQLSGGMAKKIGIIATLLTRPKLIVAENLTHGLDTISIKDLLTSLSHLTQMPFMIVLSQDPTFISATCHMPIILESLDQKEMTNEKNRHLLKGLGEQWFFKPKAQLQWEPSHWKEEPLLILTAIDYSLQVKGRKIDLLKKISFHMKKGEILGLVGASGSGKSTIAKIIANLYHASAGSLLYKGKPYLLCLHNPIQLIFQNPQHSINQRLTVYDALAEPLKTRGVKKTELGTMIRALLEQFELSESLQSSVSGLSLSAQQILAFIRTIAMQPELIICDEIFSYLNLEDSLKVMDYILNAQRKKKTSFIIINHDLRIINALCDRTAIIHKGEMVEWKDTPTLFTQGEHPQSLKLIESYRWLSSE